MLSDQNNFKPLLQNAEQVDQIPDNHRSISMPHSLLHCGTSTPSWGSSVSNFPCTANRQWETKSGIRWSSNLNGSIDFFQSSFHKRANVWFGSNTHNNLHPPPQFSHKKITNSCPQSDPITKGQRNKSIACWTRELPNILPTPPISIFSNSFHLCLARSSSKRKWYDLNQQNWFKIVTHRNSPFKLSKEITSLVARDVTLLCSNTFSSCSRCHTLLCSNNFSSCSRCYALLCSKGLENNNTARPFFNKSHSEVSTYSVSLQNRAVRQLHFCNSPAVPRNELWHRSFLVAPPTPNPKFSISSILLQCW